MQHPAKPPSLESIDVAGTNRRISDQPLERIKVLRGVTTIQQPVNGGLRSRVQVTLQLVPVRAETGTTMQVMYAK